MLANGNSGLAAGFKASGSNAALHQRRTVHLQPFRHPARRIVRKPDADAMVIA
jgi:hypothetical protein